jgi:Protein of unknown function (DUF732)
MEVGNLSHTRRTRLSWLMAATMVTMAVANAAPAAAGDGEYLQQLQDRYQFLSPQQLLAEGHRVCAVIDQGAGSRYAAEMVQKDIGVSPGASMDIVSAATVELGC